MTDQEKAATFIGWREGVDCPGTPGTKCESWEPDPDRPGPHVLMRYLRHIPHIIPAPNMADPRNYMKALRTYYDQAPNEDEKERRYFEIEAACGCALQKGDGMLITYLAALYDAEHATQAGAEP